MDDRNSKSLRAARRVRDIALDDAKRTLSDAVYAVEAARRISTSLSAQLAAALLHEQTMNQAGSLDVGALGLAARFRHWLNGKQVVAQQSVAAAEHDEINARAALMASLGARDAVRKLQARRQIDEEQERLRRWQQSLDDLGAVRAMTRAQSSFVQSGDPHGR
jgi:hypothetical protein